LQIETLERCLRKEYTTEKSLKEQYHLTDEQIDAATRFIDLATREVLYMVKSASDPDKAYRVTWDKRFSRFTCECKVSQIGIGCWHLRSAYVNELMYRQAKRDEAEAAKRIAEEQAEYERLMMVPPTVYSEAEIKADQERFAPKPFNLLR
jgi:hypothetical protein